MLKKIVIILIIFNVVIGLWFIRGFFGDFFLKSKEISVERESIKEQSQEKIEETLLLEEAMAVGDIKMAFKKDNKIMYYNQNNFLEVDLEGLNKKTIASYPFNGLKTAKCSKSGNFCLMWVGKDFSIYNLELKQNTDLTLGTKGAEFNSQGDGLVYLFSKEGISSLNTSDLEGKNWIQLEKIKGENLNISVDPKDNQIVYYSRNVDLDESGIFLTTISNRESAIKIIEKDIIDVLWSPLGDKLLFSYYDHSVTPKRVQLGYYDLKQKKQYELGLPSIAQKCVWSENSSVLYCAVLTSVVPQTFVLDDWYSRKFISQDIFWKIDLDSSKKEKIFSDFDKYFRVDAFNLILLKNELLFIDKVSGNLLKRKI